MVSKGEPLALHCLPEVICVEPPGELWINVDHVDIALLGITNGCLVVIACFVLSKRDAQRPIEP
jgi:hypothetical protein